MAGTDNFSSRTDITEIDGGDHSKSVEQRLITLERAQKHDLLIHLIGNLQQSLVLCGPEGIGKTTVLKSIQENKAENWIMCPIESTKQLSFERIQDDLIHTLQTINFALKGQGAQETFAHFAKQNQKIVLIFDDAGQLIPGLITMLCQYAAANPVLRIVLALTPDELHIKSSSDRAIDDCHFIDIPPLTEKQCGEFLQNLSGRPGSSISIHAINPAMIDKLYRESHGIPGKIVNLQADLSKISHSNHIKWVMLLVASLVIAAGIGYLFKDRLLLGEKNNRELPVIYQGTVQVDITPSVIDRQTETSISETVALPSANLPVENKTTPHVLETEHFTGGENDEQKRNRQRDSVGSLKENIVSVQPQLSENNPEIDSLTGDNNIAQLVIQTTQPEPAIKPHELEELPKPETQKIQSKVSVMERESPTLATELPGIVTQTKPEGETQEPVPVEQSSSIADLTEVEQTPIEKKILAPNDDTQWLFQQPGENYTLQLMSLKKKGSLTTVKKKYRHLAGDLHIYRKIKNGQERYVLLYGSFSSSVKVAKAMQSLPVEFQKPWKRRFRALQKEIKAIIKESSL